MPSRKLEPETSTMPKKLGNQRYIAALKLGITALSDWNEQNPIEARDARGADLRGVNLSGADLTGTNFGAMRPNEMPVSLEGAKLRNATLQGVNLRMANLRDADLRNADLSGSQLSIVDFRFADLRGANLSSCILIATDLDRARLKDVDLRHSIVGHTHFTGVDMSEISGLQTLKHEYPSTLDIDTLINSSGTLPKIFLEGCGVPDSFIASLGVLSHALSPVQRYSCFISFSWADKDFAEALHASLRTAGVRVWFAPEDMKGGQKLYEQVEGAIESHDRLLLVLSEESIKSDWVQTELRRALAAEKQNGRRKLFPIRICDMRSLRNWKCFDSDSGKDMAIQVREYFIPDFSDWRSTESFKHAMERLLRDLTSSSS